MLAREIARKDRAEIRPPWLADCSGLACFNFNAFRRE
jgi:hypothetical protein